MDRSIRNKINALVVETETKYAIHPLLITTYRLVENSYSENIQSVITLDDLFAQVSEMLCVAEEESPNMILSVADFVGDGTRNKLES